MQSDVEKCFVISIKNIYLFQPKYFKNQEYNQVKSMVERRQYRKKVSSFPPTFSQCPFKCLVKKLLFCLYCTWSHFLETTVFVVYVASDVLLPAEFRTQLISNHTYSSGQVSDRCIACPFPVNRYCNIRVRTSFRLFQRYTDTFKWFSNSFSKNGRTNPMFLITNLTLQPTPFLVANSLASGSCSCSSCFN